MITNQKDQNIGPNQNALPPHKWNIPMQQNRCYFNQFKKLIQTASSLIKQSHEIIQDKHKSCLRIQNLKECLQQLKSVKEKQFSQSNAQSDKPKRIRRKNQQLQKNWICPVQKCQKRYSSQGSLQQHMKLKHHSFISKPKQSKENQRNQLKQEISNQID